MQSLLVLLGLFAALLVIAWLLRGLLRATAEPAPSLANQTITDQTTTNQTATGRTTMVHVIAIITAKPGKREEILGHFRANVPNVLKEEGCIEYAAAIDATPALPIQTEYGTDTFVVIEKWASLDALKAHAAAPHMAAYAAKTKEHIATRLIHVLSPA